MNDLDLKKLNKLIALCRKLGVESIRVGDIEVTLGSAPLKKVSKAETRTSFNTPDSPFAQYLPPMDDIETDGLTDEQLMFYSARPEAGVSNGDTQ